ncbi:hypothetical protein WAF17_16600 [Bernardetia sp. ABR2-2B]|uniref:hypothetical protein n=1 Tax=Bernardetia sp. ABR2-2B TaxID=3127472 RepID=UPI0030D00F08
MNTNTSLTQVKIKLLSEIIRDFNSVEYENNPTASYLEGRQTENDRLTILIQQKYMALVEQRSVEEQLGLKCFQLFIPKSFPKNHKKAGQETQFAKRIITGRMIQVLKKDYAYWLDVVRKVQDGEAYISVVEWEQNRTETQREVLRLDASSNIEIQKVTFSKKFFYLRRVRLCPDELAENCGFNTTTDFKNYYKSFPKSELAMIQFTGFRY